MTTENRSELRRNAPLLATATLGVSLQTVAIYALGQVTRQFETEFGWTRTEVSAGMTISLILTFLLTPIVGRLVDTMNPRYLAIPGALLTALALAAFSLTDGSHMIWVLAWCLQAVGTSLAGPTVWIAVITSRFSVNRSLAIGIAMCGAGLAAGLVPPVMRHLIDAFDWRVAYQLLGLFWAGSVALLATLFFFDGRRRPSTKAVDPFDRRGPDFRMLLLSSRFLKIAVAMIALLMTVAACIVHLAPALVDKGFSREVAAGLAGIAGFSTLAGKLAIGWLFDRVRLILVTTGLSALLALGCALLALVDGQVNVALTACIVFGAAAGSTYAISACLVTRFFPAQDFGLVFGTLSGFIALAGALAPAGASMIHDRFGSYMIVFWSGVILCVVAASLLAALTPAPAASRAAADPEPVRQVPMG